MTQQTVRQGTSRAGSSHALRAPWSLGRDLGKLVVTILSNAGGVLHGSDFPELANSSNTLPYSFF